MSIRKKTFWMIYIVNLKISYITICFIKFFRMRLFYIFLITKKYAFGSYLKRAFFYKVVKSFIWFANLFSLINLVGDCCLFSQYGNL